MYFNQQKGGSVTKIQYTNESQNVDLLAGDGVLYPLIDSPGSAGGDRLPNM